MRSGAGFWDDMFSVSGRGFVRDVLDFDGDWEVDLRGDIGGAAGVSASIRGAGSGSSS